MRDEQVLAAPRAERATIDRVGAVVCAAVFALVMAGGALPIPLYGLWAPQLGFGPLTTTVVFVAYVVGVAAALVLLGSVSDTSGRRTMLGVALGAAAVSTVLFALAVDVPMLLLGRFLSGVATGIAASTATAALMELIASSRSASAVASAVNLGGIGLGTVIGGVFGQDVVDPTRTVFWAYLLSLGVAALALLRMPETVEHRTALRLTPRRPALPDPGVGRRHFIGAALLVAAGFGVNGFFSSLAPAFLADQLHVDDLAVVGLEIGLLFAAALAAQLLAPRFALRSPVPGALVLLLGLLLMLVGLGSGVAVTFVVATAVAGAGVGVTFRRGLILTDRVAAPDSRAELGATYFLIAYLGLIAPTLTLGVLDQVAGRTVAVLTLAGVVLVTAAVGLVATGIHPESLPDDHGAHR